MIPCLYLCFHPSGENDELNKLSENKVLDRSIKYNMRKSLDLDQEGCYLQTGKKECLEKCSFNATAKTIFIIHGWTVLISLTDFPSSYLLVCGFI